MNNGLFRQSALQALARPEQLDQFLTLTRPRAWLGLGALAMILAAVLIWGIFGSLPTTVVGTGILISRGGVFNVVALGNGVVTEMADLKVGDPVRKGQVLGRIDQPAMAQQIQAAQIELERLEKEEADVIAMIHAQQTAQEHSFVSRKNALQNIIHAKEEHLRSLNAVKQSRAGLVSEGLITKQGYEETQQLIYAEENAIDEVQNQLQQLGLEKLGNADQHSERLRMLRSRILQGQNQLQDMQLRQRLAVDIISQHDGNIIETMTTRGSAITTGQAILSLEITAKNLEAVIYLPPLSNAKRLQPGMTARISPVTYKKERYGYLLGKVKGVAKYPATAAGMMAMFNNESLVGALSQQGPPIAVSVDLLTDPSTASGYAWSSDTGAKLELSGGTMATGNFIIESKRPISLVLPWLRELTGL